MTQESLGAARDGARTAPARPLALTLAAAPDAVGVMRRAAADLAREHGADADLAFDVALAVSEAVTNAVKYAYGRKRKGKVEMAAGVRDRFLEISIRDWGTGFGAGSSDGLGLGLALIARVSTEMTVVQEGRGTQVRMRFLLAASQ
jgi:anti-sigma regulatory factor (Ser/Thr protein kinase)